MKTVATKINARVFDVLDRVSKILGVTKSEILRQALLKYLEELQETAFFAAVQNMRQKKERDCYA